MQVCRHLATEPGDKSLWPVIQGRFLHDHTDDLIRIFSYQLQELRL